MHLWEDMAKMNFGASAPLPQLNLAPELLLDLQREYMQRLGGLWTDFLEHPDRITEPIKDARFSDPAWQQNAASSMLARAYLLNADFMRRMAEAVQSDNRTKKRVRYAVDQWVEASAPSNFLALNPRAQKTLLESGGESLQRGIHNLLGDLQKGKISQT
ncbi:MAG: class I poly(R)-hydroxyalkanoic acid synthase, partial [Betaproteobacteria bacterium]